MGQSAVIVADEYAAEMDRALLAAKSDWVAAVVAVAEARRRLDVAEAARAAAYKLAAEAAAAARKEK